MGRVQRMRQWSLRHFFYAALLFSLLVLIGYESLVAFKHAQVLNRNGGRGSYPLPAMRPEGLLQHRLGTDLVGAFGEGAIRETGGALASPSETGDTSTVQSATDHAALSTGPFPVFTQILYVDWNYRADLLALAHYRALERLMVVYPGAEIVFLLTAPTAANYYKWRDRVR
jgi:hypothetical protein